MTSLEERVARAMCDETLWQEDHETLKLHDVFESAFGDDAMEKAMEIILPKLSRAAIAVCAQEMAHVAEVTGAHAHPWADPFLVGKDAAAAIRSMGERG